MFKKAFQLARLFPVELVILLVASGGLSGRSELTQMERFLVMSVIFSIVLSILRSSFFLGLWRETADFLDSDAGFPETGYEIGDPWSRAAGHMWAAGHPPPPTPRVTAFSIRQLFEVIDNLADVFGDMGMVIGDRHPIGNQLSRLNGELRRATLQHWGALRAANQGKTPESEWTPAFAGKLMHQTDAAALLSSLSTATYQLVSCGVALGLPADEGFEATANYYDGFQNQYGRIMVNPVSGAWEPDPEDKASWPPAVNYAELLDEYYRGPYAAS